MVSSSLFDFHPGLPDGFFYVPDFLSIEDEEFLIKEIKKHELETFIFKGYEAKRKIKSFGYDYSFTSGGLSRGVDVPPSFLPLIDKVAKQAHLPAEAFAELLLTEYPPGAVINWHRDAPPFDVVAGVSLASDCVFRLRPQDKSRQGRGSIISLPVTRRSLYIMKGPARSEWQHSITPVEDTRYSITLRTLK